MTSRVISFATTVRELAILLESSQVLFVQRNNVLLGSVTNGDFRRGISAGVGLEESVEAIMNRSPVLVRETDDYNTRLCAISRLPKGLRFLPVLNANGEILEIVSDKALHRLPNRVVILAGGLGSRLKGLTEATPKPMLKVGDRPILQMIIEQFRRAGISHFYISVRYKAEAIKRYFRDGADFEVNIQYLDETEPLGTAGCLSLLSEPFKEPFFVMNSDVLTDVNFYELMEHHISSECAATVCLHTHQVSIPYGVAQIELGRLLRIIEKPTERFAVNAGIYVLSPQCLGLIAPGKPLEPV